MRLITPGYGDWDDNSTKTPAYYNRYYWLAKVLGVYDTTPIDQTWNVSSTTTSFSSDYWSFTFSIPYSHSSSPGTIGISTDGVNGYAYATLNDVSNGTGSDNGTYSLTSKEDITNFSTSMIVMKGFRATKVATSGTSYTYSWRFRVYALDDPSTPTTSIQLFEKTGSGSSSGGNTTLGSTSDLNIFYDTSTSTITVSWDGSTGSATDVSTISNIYLKMEFYASTDGQLYSGGGLGTTSADPTSGLYNMLVGSHSFEDTVNTRTIYPIVKDENRNWDTSITVLGDTTTLTEDDIYQTSTAGNKTIKFQYNYSPTSSTDPFTVVKKFKALGYVKDLAP